jgi:hypothetical protein
LLRLSIQTSYVKGSAEDAEVGEAYQHELQHSNPVHTGDQRQNQLNGEGKMRGNREACVQIPQLQQVRGCIELIVTTHRSYYLVPYV